MKSRGRQQECIARILVLRGGAIGDLILTFPALAAIRRKWPDAHIELAGYPRVAQLAEAGGLVNNVVSLDSADSARLFAADADLAPELAARVRSFDLIVSYLNDPDGVLRNNLATAGVRRLVCGSPLIADRHAIDALLKPLQELGVHPAPNEYARLHLSDRHLEEGRKRTAGFGEKVIVLHPGSGSPKKNWPLDRFVLLADQLRQETSLTPVFTLGEADEAIAREPRFLTRRVSVLPPCSLTDLAVFLSACNGYAGNDSGITHLAASVGIPVVALFGPTDPGLWAPRGPNVTILRAASPAEGLAGIAVKQVLDTLLGSVV